MSGDSSTRRRLELSDRHRLDLADLVRRFVGLLPDKRQRGRLLRALGHLEAAKRAPVVHGPRP